MNAHIYRQAALLAKKGAEFERLERVVESLREKLSSVRSRETRTEHRAHVSRGIQTESNVLGDVVKRSPSPLRPYPIADFLPEPVKEESLDSVLVKNEPTDTQAMGLLNVRQTATLPDVKVKKSDDVLRLDPTTGVQWRLEEAGCKPFTVNLDPAIRDATVTRKFTSATLGGSLIATCPRIAADKYEALGKDFMYVNLEYHPYGPRLPGEMGLWLDPDDSELAGQSDLVRRTFIRRAANIWLYVGQYKLIPSSPLTRQEWLLQPKTVKTTWASDILSKSWGAPTRAAIIIRRDEGRELTEEETNAISSRDDRLKNVTLEEIIESFDKGKQLMHTWAMRCVGYDENFQR
ncbi:hypothetical protein BV25DRAFT_1138684 [Artomyces pyxidatus]|uniref:Uncharacterized protein n=1 Tax=Artomyces pyxidatus TaxID=48021 RepID=A0ACB8SS14_9AGAM|nr:hypothetical protein BV25DRAFT_1138684 [Artomyces pyxidatus]